jgi:hypothetical protein
VSRKPQFPFLELPAEVRNQIYELLLTSDEPILNPDPRPGEPPIEGLHTLTPTHIPPLGQWK